MVSNYPTVEEEKLFLYSLKFNIWGPMIYTDKTQISKRKERGFKFMYTHGNSHKNMA